jgi:hypothetical protein
MLGCTVFHKTTANPLDDLIKGRSSRKQFGLPVHRTFVRRKSHLAVTHCPGGFVWSPPIVRCLFSGKITLSGEFEMPGTVYLVTKRICPLASSDFLPLKDVLPKPPKGYFPYLKKFGMGIYCGFLIILSPRQIVDELRQYRESIRRLLDGSDSPPSESNLDPDQLVPIGRSIDGDILVVHPDTPSVIHALPRQDNCPYLLPDGFEDVLHWRRLVTRNGEYVQRSDFRFFESFENRGCVELHSEQNHDNDELLAWFMRSLPRGATRVFDEESDSGVILLFVRRIEGSVCLMNSRIRIDFDLDCRATVQRLVKEVESLGFTEC